MYLDQRLRFGKFVDHGASLLFYSVCLPKDLTPAVKRALAVVKRGEPALLDVVTQPR